jgi:hypothetical protein
MFALLRCYAESTGSKLPTFRDNPSAPPSMVKQHINRRCATAQKSKYLISKLMRGPNNPSTTQSLRGTSLLGGYTLVMLPRIVTPYRDSVDETRVRVTYQKLVTRTRVSSTLSRYGITIRGNVTSVYQSLIMSRYMNNVMEVQFYYTSSRCLQK